VISAGLASGLLWPAEAEVQTLLAGTADEATRARLADRGRTLEIGAAAIAACFLVALAVMVAQP
jgi:hypothetical protein